MFFSNQPSGISWAEENDLFWRNCTVPRSHSFITTKGWCTEEDDGRPTALQKETPTTEIWHTSWKVVRVNSTRVAGWSRVGTVEDIQLVRWEPKGAPPKCFLYTLLPSPMGRRLAVWNAVGCASGRTQRGLNCEDPNVLFDGNGGFPALSSVNYVPDLWHIGGHGQRVDQTNIKQPQIYQSSHLYRFCRRLFFQNDFSALPTPCSKRSNRATQTG